MINDERLTINIAMKRASKAFFSTLCLLLLITSCEHKELCYHHPHAGEFNVMYDWSDAPEADPAGMRLYFYRTDGSDRDSWNLNTVGATLDVYETDYHALTFNNDTEWIRFQNVADYDSHSATTRIGGLYEPITGSSTNTTTCPQSGEQVMVPPDPLWGIGEADYHVNMGDTLWLKPQPLYCIYTVEFRNIKHIDQIMTMSSSLTGMAQSVNIADGELSRELCTIPFEVEPGSDGKTIVGRFLTFGHHEDNVEPHRLALYFEMIDGKYIQYTQGDYLDVTDQVHSAPNKRRVHLIVDTPGIPSDDVIDQIGGGGFDVDVEQWGDGEDKDLEFGFD